MRGRRPLEQPKQLWLLTYSDMVTLLLSFFVLLLAMSTLDRNYVSQVSLGTGRPEALGGKAAGQVPSRIQGALELIGRPWEAYTRQDRIRDLLFPDEELPPEVDRKTLNENLRILARNDGVALVLTDRLLFQPGSAALQEPGAALLRGLRELLLATRAPVVVAAYTDPGDAKDGADPYALATDRALAVLTFLVDAGMPNERFALAAYGPTNPMADSGTPEGQTLNRRVEIFLKTVPDLGGYMSH